MSSDDESTSKIILPILEDQEDSDLSLDPSIHDSVPDGPDDDADMSDDHLLVCELCGAADVDLAEWGVAGSVSHVSRVRSVVQMSPS